MAVTATRSTADGTRKYTLPDAGDSNWTDEDGGTVLEFKNDLNVDLLDSNSYRCPLTKLLVRQLEEKRQFRDTTDDCWRNLFATCAG